MTTLLTFIISSASSAVTWQKGESAKYTFVEKSLWSLSFYLFPERLTPMLNYVRFFSLSLKWPLYVILMVFNALFSSENTFLCRYTILPRNHLSILDRRIMAKWPICTYAIWSLRWFHAKMAYLHVRHKVSRWFHAKMAYLHVRHMVSPVNSCQNGVSSR